MTIWTQWCPGDNHGGVIASGTNWTGQSASTQQFCRGRDALKSGKYYFEWTGSGGSFGSSTIITGMGVGLFTQTYATMGTGGSPNSCPNAGMAQIEGGFGCIQVAGVNHFTLLYSHPTVGQCAVDLDAGLIWLSLPSGAGQGPYNFSALASPATGVGGYPLPGTPGVSYFYPIVAASGPGLGNTAFVANFGQAAFTFSVPSGFTPGWPARQPALMGLV